MLKGITPLLAAVILVAITVGVATLSTGFISTTFQSTQFTISNKTAEATECTTAEIVIDGVYAKVGDNGTIALPLRNAGFSDNIVISSAQLYDKAGNNFSASSMPITDFDRGEIASLRFQMPSLGNTTADNSTSGNTGNCTNMGRGGANNTCNFKLLGKLGSAMNFDGADDYVNISDGAAFDNIFLEGTVTAWGLINNMTGGPRHIVFSLTPRLEVSVENNDLRLSLHGYLDRQVLNDSITRADTWYHVAVTWSNSSNFSTGYVDGIRGYNFTYSNQTNHLGSELHIGARSSTEELWNGTIDEVSIWNRSLSGSEINSTMNSGVTSIGTTGLVGYWRFDEGRGVLVCDDFSQVIVTTNCGGISAAFTRKPICS